ncbi:MAG TPA: ACP S-malonyltransferase [Acidimicrobiales bacterium]|nr:ACP S-malonyltransferase [Acidimicrobiales bacterium]
MIIFTFPGQGSQRSGMGKDWIGHPSWEVVTDASDASGRDIGHLLLDAPQGELTQTRNAQLATFTMSLMVLDALERVGLEPGGCAGHSLGEYTALVASGAVGFEDGVRLVVERGEAMQIASEDNPGTMAAALGISDDDAQSACLRAETDVWVANFNAPGQVVLAGTVEGVERAGHIAKSLGAKKILSIPVGGAFHTPLMAPAREHLRKAISSTKFSDPEIPLVANVDAKQHDSGTEWPSLLSAALCSPVRWHQTLATFNAMEPKAFIEVGPGGVLVGLARRIVGDAKALVVSKPEDVDFLLGVLSDNKQIQAYVGSHSGEHTHMSERVIVSPIGGIFEPVEGLAAPEPAARHTRASNALQQQSDEGNNGAFPAKASNEDSNSISINTGDLLGNVSGVEVRTQFSGSLMGLLVLSGERVAAGQPVAWLRVEPD